jgi:hypothetical protein
MNPLMLPSAPKDVGRLSAVLPSALASLGLAFSNSFRLTKVKHSIVIFIDGLGYENLVNAGAHARFLNRNLEDSIRCEFPSTTATSIAGFATGHRSHAHGLIGYTVYNRVTKSPMNLLTGWKSRSEASAFKNQETLSEQVNLRFGVFGPAVYQDSGFTELTMKGAEYIPAETIAERFDSVAEFIKGESSFSYLYIPELDQLAHRLGVESTNWLETLEEVDSLLASFVNSLPANVGVIVTADHGLLDVPSTSHYFLDDQPWFDAAVDRTGGDPRCNFLYLNDQTQVARVKASLTEAFGHAAYVLQPREISESGWAHWDGATAENLVPDLVLIWNSLAVGYDRRTASANSMKMVGQHGGISDRETRVPFIKIGAY